MAQDRPLLGTTVKTLLVSDLVDSTLLAQKLGDERVAEIFRRHDRIARDLLPTCEGVEADRTDGFLLLFDRPINAVRYALAFHRAMARLSAEEGVELAFRVGIHLGEVVLIETPAEDVARGAKPLEVEGLAKPTAARLMSVALGRQTLLSRGAFDMARRAVVGDSDEKEELTWLAHGRYVLKGVEEPVHVFEVGIEGFSPLEAPPTTEKVRRLEEDAILGWRPAAGLGVPERLHWVLERKLGEGGFGEVWLAAHAKTRERRVFKFCFEAARLRSLRREITLFRLLKEALGEREDITRILDWSFEEAPYFIESEYTAGGDLMDWMEAEGGFEALAFEDRLEIVAQIAEALSAAHSVGVLHKDVKPRNVLMRRDLEGRPRAQLTDFGVGGLADEASLENAGITLAGITEAMGDVTTGGTRLYMAPEIVEGKRATVQADVYALGVLLYQVVLGDFSRSLAPGWERDVDDELLRRDIAWAVDGEPSQRLGNALRLAQHLRTLPERRAAEEAERRAAEEAARDHAALLKARKRRKLVVAAVAALSVFAGSMGFFAYRISEEKERADREATAARRVTDFLVGLFEVSNPTLAQGETITARELLDRGAERITRQLKDQPRIRSRIQGTVGTIYRQLGLYERAEPLLETALEERRRLGNDAPGLAATLRELAELYRDRGRYPEAQGLAGEAVALCEAAGPAGEKELVRALQILGILHVQQGDFEAAEPLLERSLALAEVRLGPGDPDVARGLNALGSLAIRRGDLAAAEERYRRSLDLWEEQGDDLQTSRVLNNLAIVAKEGQRFEEAESLYRRVIEIGERMLGPGHPDVAASLNNLANGYFQQGRFREVEPLYRRALEIRRAALGEDHPDTANSVSNLGYLYASLGRPEEAERFFEEAIATYEAAVGAENPVLAEPLFGLANLYRDLGRTADAEPLYQRILTLLEASVGTEHPDYQQARAVYEGMLGGS